MEPPGRKREINRKRRCGAFLFCCAPEYHLEKIRRMARSDEPKADENPIF